MRRDGLRRVARRDHNALAWPARNGTGYGGREDCLIADIAETVVTDKKDHGLGTRRAATGPRRAGHTIIATFQGISVLGGRLVNREDASVPKPSAGAPPDKLELYEQL